MAAVVTAAAGATVVKHGNRAASSSCGAADLLEELGVAIDLPPAGVAECVREVGIGFCFAPVFHPALRHAAVARRELGVATVFNFLGPLANPARPRAQAVGVSDARMAPVLAGVLAARGCSALVFRGDDGLDELTTTTTSSVWVTRDGEVHEATVDPRRFGIRAADPADLRGADAAYNAKVARSVLGGEPGPVRDTVALNAAAGLTAYSLTDAPLDEQLAAGLERARAALDSGRPAELLERWAAASQQAARSMSA
jgi:anthranilate phosphoribosyltransferase